MYQIVKAHRFLYIAVRCVQISSPQRCIRIMLRLGGGSGCLQPLHPLLPAAALQHNPACMHHLPTRPPATVSLVTASPTSFDLQSWRWRLRRTRWWQLWLASTVGWSVGAVCLVMACLSAYVACDPVPELASPLPPPSALIALRWAPGGGQHGLGLS